MTSCSALQRKQKQPNTSSSIPRLQVNLEHVFGFTSMSNSLISQDHSTVAYAAGRTVILFNKNTHKQDFIISTACKTITSLSLSPDGRYLATGEIRRVAFVEDGSCFVTVGNRHIKFWYSVAKSTVQ
ncbi:unnamed protein product [Rotaria sp. Silwood1]|nr:unnamed protein product [Rotaria sp. Silwood1]